VLFVDAMRWLVGEESYSGQTNSEEDLHIEHTKQQDLAWFYSTIFGVPAVVLGVGLLIRRRALAGGSK
jgi:gliding motility-associatede transport system auxiliary component